MKLADLIVYKKLCDLTLVVNDLTLTFPKFEIFELGSQLRRASNSAPANLAECFGNKHTNVYTEGISRAQGEIRETIHHLQMASRKKYFTAEILSDLINQYEECSKMLFGLEKALYKAVK